MGGEGERMLRPPAEVSALHALWRFVLARRDSIVYCERRFLGKPDITTILTLILSGVLSLILSGVLTGRGSSGMDLGTTAYNSILSVRLSWAGVCRLAWLAGGILVPSQNLHASLVLTVVAARS